MPNPGSHAYDVRRTRLRAEFEDSGVPDQHADRAANEELQRSHPPQPVGPEDRAAGPLGAGTGRQDNPPAAGGIELRSPAFNDHTLMPDRFSYDGGNASPPLEWGSVPEGTQELVLLCEDPDAPGGVFVHWVVTGIDPRSTGVGEDELPQGASAGRNDFGELGWGGPRPPVGDEPHRYFIRLYALDRRLEMDNGVTAADVRDAVERCELAKGTLVGLFGR